MKAVCIISPSTNVGKTFVTTALAYQLCSKNYNIRVVKPIISGWENYCNDTVKIIQSMSLPVSEENVEKISPWRFSAPLSAAMAAAKENRLINLQEVANFCLDAKENFSKDYLLIEGVGGISSPLTESETFMDLIKIINNKLELKLILVTGTYLGSLSHAITCYEAIKANKLNLEYVIVTETQGSEVPLEEVNISLSHFIKKPIISIPWVNQTENTWKYVNMLPEVK